VLIAEPQYWTETGKAGEIEPASLELAVESFADWSTVFDVRLSLEAVPGAAARVGNDPEPSSINASTTPTKITASGGIRNPDRQPPWLEAVVWSKGGEKYLGDIAPETCYE
jgi:hypothetical protein